MKTFLIIFFATFLYSQEFYTSTEQYKIDCKDREKYEITKEIKFIDNTTECYSYDHKKRENVETKIIELAVNIILL